MDPFTVTTTIDRPREELFAYLADIANHPEFADHYLGEFHLTREDPYGEGAGARYRLRAPKWVRFPYGDMTFTEVEAPRRILARGREGKYNRTLTRAVWELDAAAGGTRVTYTFETKPKLPSDVLLEKLGGRRRRKRQATKALKRLRSIFEEDRGRGQRATIAGGPRKPASQFRYEKPLSGARD